MTASRHFLIHTGVLTSNGTQISNDWKLTHMTGIWVIASQDPDSLRTRHGVPVPEAAKAVFTVRDEICTLWWNQLSYHERISLEDVPDWLKM